MMTVMDRKGREEGELICIRGIIVPWSWDEKGLVVDVVIDAEEEQRYFPIPIKKNRELAAYFRCSVEIRGFIEQGYDDRLYLEVIEYKITRKPG